MRVAESIGLIPEDRWFRLFQEIRGQMGNRDAVSVKDDTGAEIKASRAAGGWLRCVFLLDGVHIMTRLFNSDGSREERGVKAS